MPSDKIEKKRKRTAEDRHERPSKKPAPANAPAPTPGLQDLPPLATKVIEDDSELAPVIGTFLSNHEALKSNAHIKSIKKKKS